MSVNYLSLFNDHFIEFIDDVITVFPTNVDLLASKNGLIMLRKANPKLLISKFYLNFVLKFRSKIEAGDLDFFTNKDYNNEVKEYQLSDKISESIDKLREPIRLMCDGDKCKCVQYVQNLTKLAELYIIENPL